MRLPLLQLAAFRIQMVPETLAGPQGTLPIAQQLLLPAITMRAQGSEGLFFRVSLERNWTSMLSQDIQHTHKAFPACFTGCPVCSNIGQNLMAPTLIFWVPIRPLLIFLGLRSAAAYAKRKAHASTQSALCWKTPNPGPHATTCLPSPLQLPSPEPGQDPHLCPEQRHSWSGESDRHQLRSEGVTELARPFVGKASGFGQATCPSCIGVPTPKEEMKR